jgi:hypothetical protein
MLAEIAAYGAACVCFGAVLGYLLGPSIVARIRRPTRSPGRYPRR